jgi:hypothetical protein
MMRHASQIIPRFATAILIGLSLAATAAPGKPNIVFVITDDQGYGDLGRTGNPIIKTPHIDRLAAESSQLTDYHVAPTCSPTRSALLTGHWTDRTGVWHTINGRSMLRGGTVCHHFVGELSRGELDDLLARARAGVTSVKCANAGLVSSPFPLQAGDNNKERK